ncbi:protein of unknown function [Rhodovastum atsumiense]|nr:protein of unknown function [Rhodovastum atsumiense]
MPVRMSPTEVAAESMVEHPDPARATASSRAPASPRRPARRRPPWLRPVGSPQGAPGKLAVIRDAETKTLLRTCANPLFRAAGLDVNLVRIIVTRDVAINSFVSTGNRLFAGPRHTAAGIPPQSALARGHRGVDSWRRRTSRCRRRRHPERTGRDSA